MIALAVAACGGSQTPGPAPARDAAPVRAEPAESLALSSNVRSVGILAPRDEIRLSFKTGGVVDRIAVDVGDAVRKGQLLAVIKRAEVDAAVAQASEAAEKARRGLERGRRLRADEVATEEQVEDLTTAYNVARSNLDAARFNARFARIEAPGDGVVLQRLAEQDELVQPGSRCWSSARRARAGSCARRSRTATRSVPTSAIRRPLLSMPSPAASSRVASRASVRARTR